MGGQPYQKIFEQTAQKAPYRASALAPAAYRRLGLTVTTICDVDQAAARQVAAEFGVEAVASRPELLIGRDALRAGNQQRARELLAAYRRPTTAEIAAPLIEELNKELGRTGLHHVSVTGRRGTKAEKINLALAEWQQRHDADPASPAPPVRPAVPPVRLAALSRLPRHPRAPAP